MGTQSSDSITIGNQTAAVIGSGSGGGTGFAGAAIGNKLRGRPPVGVSVLICAALGAFCVLAFALQTPHFVQTVSVGLLTASCTFVVGATIGFLFGIPRAMDSNEAGHKPHPESDQPNGTHHGGYGANTNLEQISDWLTKILVGVTLTQIEPIYNGFSKLATHVGTALQPAGDVIVGSVFAGTILIYFLFCGFMLGYLCTRVFLPKIFTTAEVSALNALGRQVTEQVQKIDERIDTEKAALRQQLETDVNKSLQERMEEEKANLRKGREAEEQEDSRAYEVIEGQLNQTHQQPYRDETVMQAVQSASHPVQEHFFQMAKEARRLAWRRKGDEWREWSERTIPVFRGLVELPRWAKRHGVFAQLGYALKDKRPPEWDNALQHLGFAITISEELEIPVAPHYSFNWALCRVAIEARDNENNPSDDSLKEEIVGALRNGMKFSSLRDAVSDPKNEHTDALRSWMIINEVGQEELGHMEESLEAA